jgi:hypothetical protein
MKVNESMKDGSSEDLRNEREVHGPLFDQHKRCSKLIEEFPPKPFALALVPQRHLEGVKFGFWTNLQTGHLPTGVEALL